MKTFTRTLLFAFFAFFAVNPLTLQAASLPFVTYIYDYFDNIILTPAAYYPARGVSGEDLGIGHFTHPQGLHADNRGFVYVADTGNDRVVVLAPCLTRVLHVIEYFEAEEGIVNTFNRPTGVFVSSRGYLYVADTENRRVVSLDLSGENPALVRVIENPQGEILGAHFEFRPLKLAVDYADRVYVVARGMFQGLMVFDTAGNFTGFFGTVEVQITFWEIIWRMLSTQEQRARQLLFIPTEFTGVDVDAYGFIFASNIDITGEQAVRRLNPKGEDIIRRGGNENLGGDLQIEGFTRFAGPSVIIDVVYRGYGMYSLLDSRRGRIFTYDEEGNLLYIFGGIGTQRGTFHTPTAIASSGDMLFALDSFRAEIIVFNPTEYGRLINAAVALRHGGNDAAAVEYWREVLRLNENFELANANIGRSYLAAGNNRMAMHYLRLGMDRDFYSVAFRRHRNDILVDNLGWALTGAIGLIFGLILLRRLVFRKKKPKEEESVWNE